eukprot:1177028-Prorocentrum_minimum.AAC.3
MPFSPMRAAAPGAPCSLAASFELRATERGGTSAGRCKKTPMKGGFMRGEMQKDATETHRQQGRRHIENQSQEGGEDIPGSRTSHRSAYRRRWRARPAG